MHTNPSIPACPTCKSDHQVSKILTREDTEYFCGFCKSIFSTVAEEPKSLVPDNIVSLSREIAEDITALNQRLVDRVDTGNKVVDVLSGAVTDLERQRDAARVEVKLLKLQVHSNALTAEYMMQRGDRLSHENDSLKQEVEELRKDSYCLNRIEEEKLTVRYSPSIERWEAIHPEYHVTAAASTRLRDLIGIVDNLLKR